MYTLVSPCKSSNEWFQYRDFVLIFWHAKMWREDTLALPTSKCGRMPPAPPTSPPPWLRLCCTQNASRAWSVTAHTDKVRPVTSPTQREGPRDAKLRRWSFTKETVALKSRHVIICAINHRHWRQNPAIVWKFENVNWCYAADICRTEHLRYFGAENDQWIY